LRQHLVDVIGTSASAVLGIFEQLRNELGYADYLGAPAALSHRASREAQVLQISLYLLRYPFAESPLSGALDLLSQLHRVAAPSSSPTATSSFSRARSSAQACGARSTASPESISTRRDARRRRTAIPGSAVREIDDKIAFSRR